MNPVVEVGLTLAGIVLPSAVLAGVVNRWLTPVSVRLTSLLIGLVVVTLHLGVLSPAMPVPLGEVLRGYPYKGVVGEVEVRNPVTNDTVKQMLPWMNVAREELASGRAPLWNRYSFSGYPLLGNAQSAPLSPFFLATIFVPIPKQIVAMAGLKLFVALLFGFLFLREEGLCAAAALAGAIVFAFSVFQNVYLYYPMTAVSCLLPALAWTIVRSIRGGGSRDRVALSLVTAAAFSAGHPETVLHLALASAVVVVVELASTATAAASAKRSGLTLAFAFLGVTLAAAMWLPTVEPILSSQRVDILEAGTLESPVFPLQAMWAAIHPDGFGNPARGNWRWLFNYPMVASTFVGLIPLLLIPGAILASASDRKARLYAVGALGFLLVAMRWTFVGEFFNALPLAGSSANDRLRFVMVFFVAIAVARRLDLIARRGPSLVDIFSGLVVILLSVYVYQKLVFATIVPGHVVLIGGAVVFVIACLAASMSVWRNWRLEGASSLPMIAVVVIAVELFVVNLPFNALTPRSWFAPSLPIVDAIRANAPNEPFRVVGFDWVFLPNASAQYGLEDVRGSDPMAWGPYTRFFERIQAADQNLDLLRTQRVDDSTIDFLNVRFLMGEPGFEAGPGWRKVYSGPDGELFENEEWVRRFFAPARLVSVETVEKDGIGDLRATAIVEDLVGQAANHPIEGMWLQQTSPSRFRLTIDASTESFIASSQPAVPGWTVEVNGEPAPIVLVNGAFIGFRVPPGTSKVRVSYEPASWKIGVVVSVLSLIGLVFVARRAPH